MAVVDINPPNLTRGFINPEDGPLITFPPFPVPSSAITIVAFKDFKEGGICLDPGPEDAEVDTLGIPTVPLKSSHKTDMCKSNTKRKRKAEEASARKKSGPLASRIPWHEQWDDTEMIRFSRNFNPNSSRFERIHAAAGDFTDGRSWPLNFASETGPRFIWEKFQRFIGIPQGSAAPKEKKKDNNEMSDDDLDGDEEDESEERQEDAQTSANVMTTGFIQALAAKNKEIATNEDNLTKFFENPEKSFRVFLSSYSRAKGYIWYDANLGCMARVLSFFVNFLLRSKVLPEIERNLRRSAEIITLAQNELPNTSILAKTLPDEFSQACKESWGKRIDGYFVLTLDKDQEDAPATEPEVIEKVKVEAPEAPVEETAPPKNVEDAGWGQGDAPWGSEATTWDNGNGPGVWPQLNEIDVEPDNNWEFPVIKALPAIGFKDLPLTHRTGIVETSTRRVKSITGPNSNPPPKPPQAEGVSEPDADGVEIDLDAKYSKVILLSMPVDWDGGECPVYSAPEIQKTSQGPVVEPGLDVPAATTPKPHDPLHDEITLLVDPGVVAPLCVGTIIGGTWVQIVRQGEATKKKKKGKSKKAAPVYWYLEETALIAPSFWAVEEFAESD